MILGIDHIVILVHDLAAATRDYEALGFTVIPGGDHADGASHNALIVFSDGTYLELLAFKREVPEHRWWRFVAGGEGLIDWALLPDAIADDIAAARSYGIEFDGPIAGGRLRPDGQEIAWEMGNPRTPGLPFLCADITPRSLRVPDGAARSHATGITGIAGITIAVHDIQRSLDAYRALLTVGMQSQSEPLHATPPSGFVTPEPGARTAILPAGPATITLAQPTRNEAVRAESDALLAGQGLLSLQQHLEQRGEGPYALTLRGTPGKTFEADPAHTHGVRLELAPS
jgi:catechol 2,3-dioxygenase-like lactoylglutathione lyase family enzyme